MICVHNSELPFPPVKNKGPYFKVLTIVWRDNGAGILVVGVIVESKSFLVALS